MCEIWITKLALITHLIPQNVIARSLMSCKCTRAEAQWHMLLGNWDTLYTVYLFFIYFIVLFIHSMQKMLPFFMRLRTRSYCIELQIVIGKHLKDQVFSDADISFSMLLSLSLMSLLPIIKQHFPPFVGHWIITAHKYIYSIVSLLRSAVSGTLS